MGPNMESPENKITCHIKSEGRFISGELTVTDAIAFHSSDTTVNFSQPISGSTTATIEKHNVLRLRARRGPHQNICLRFVTADELRATLHPILEAKFRRRMQRLSSAVTVNLGGAQDAARTLHLRDGILCVTEGSRALLEMRLEGTPAVSMEGLLAVRLEGLLLRFATAATANAWFAALRGDTCCEEMFVYMERVAYRLKLFANHIVIADRRSGAARHVVQIPHARGGEVVGATELLLAGVGVLNFASVAQLHKYATLLGVPNSCADTQVAVVSREHGDLCRFSYTEAEYQDLLVSELHAQVSEALELAPADFALKAGARRIDTAPRTNLTLFLPRGGEVCLKRSPDSQLSNLAQLSIRRAFLVKEIEATRRQLLLDDAAPPAAAASRTPDPVHAE
eukprot:gnl/Chilomastix_cuspidata/1282.p1 GENE.gnl/Chilomastix_cuspidata/1282~~gnl/Chilomastix_cuspidata/1282.p1  ORF type:complete len:396 (+),score=189.10 gnl/Chilomastix_cuspidata/1282:2030-3217(+)